MILLFVGIFPVLLSCGEKGQEVDTDQAGTPKQIAVVSPTPAPVPEPTPAPGDEVRKLRNEGCAALDNDDFKVAIGYFERCCKLSDDSVTDVANLGMALYGDGQFEKAENRLGQALAMDPDNPTILYHLGLTYKKLQKLEEAVDTFRKLIAIDPTDATTFYQLGTVLDQLGRMEEAESAFKQTIELDPIHASSYYRLMALYRKQKRRDEMKSAMEAFQTLRKTVPDSKRSEKELEKGKYSGAIWPSFGSEGAPLVESPRTYFVEITSLLQPSAAVFQGGISEGRIAVADINRDTWMDFLIVAQGAGTDPSSIRLYENQSGFRFQTSNLTDSVAQSEPISDARFGDFNNDGYRDLFAIGKGVAVLDNQNGRPAQGEEVVGLPHSDRYSLAFLFDEDHDGDLDLLLVPSNKAPKTKGLAELYRNDGSRHFSDVTQIAGLPGTDDATVNDVAFLDADMDDDIDFLLATSRGPLLFSNLRQGRFENATQEAGLSVFGPAQACDAADINHDGLLDIVLQQMEGCVVLVNAGPGRFAHMDQPEGLAHQTAGTSVSDLKLSDLNGDGNQDLLVIATTETEDRSPLRIFFGNAGGEFTDRTDQVIHVSPDMDLYACAVEDLDRDGDPDLVLLDRNAGLRMFRNDTQGARWVSVMLHGTKNCTEGIGTKVEAKVRNTYQKILAERELVRFGIGGMGGVDVVRLQWPNGVLQGATQVAAGEIFHATEREGEIGSCPYLYTWNGEEFVFVTDVIDTSPLGLLVGQDEVFPPRGFEVVRITSDQLKPRDGSLLLRFTEELRELAYFDEVWLEAIDHPRGTEVYPDERFSMPPFPSGEPVVIGKNARPPVRAYNANGEDVLDRIKRLDHQYPDPGQRIPYTGFTEGQTLIVNLGNVQEKDRVMLLLTGYLRWGYSSSLYAISQDKQVPGQWPSFSVIDRDGTWEEILPNYGFPAGKMKTMLVDLTGKFPTSDCRVRIETNMEIYWDRILVDNSSDLPEIRRNRTPLTAAHLHPRGYCKQRIVDGRALSLPDYDNYDPVSPFPLQVGHFTRYGNVTELLQTADDDLVVFNQGDEVAIAFDSSALPEIPEGWNRTYLVHVMGWVKDGDVNTIAGATVEPMPFKDMKEYPYSERDIVAKQSSHQTRLVTEVMPPLEP